MAVEHPNQEPATAPPDVPELLVYSRQGCHLCEDMLAALAGFQSELGYRYTVYDVDADPALFDQYNALVPVVTMQGRELMRYFFELATLKEALIRSA